jgi:hypothetical protein
MSAATQQDYRPEWIYTGFGFQDWDGYGRGNDAEQMQHAFGLGVLPPLTSGDPALTPFDWYWGPNQGVFGVPGLLWMNFAYSAIHYAGPTLTAETMRDGLFSVPAGHRRRAKPTLQPREHRNDGRHETVIRLRRLSSPWTRLTRWLRFVRAWADFCRR